MAEPNPNLQLGFEYVSMEELLETADIISLHCPLVSSLTTPRVEPHGRRTVKHLGPCHETNPATSRFRALKGSKWTV